MKIIRLLAALAAALLWLMADSAVAQNALQYVQVTNGDVSRPDSTGQVTDLATCQSIVATNLSLAPSYGYTVSGGTFTDPATGYSITQTCPLSDPLYDPDPPHPVNAYQGAGNSNPPMPPQVACPSSGTILVVATFGQSIHSNTGESKYQAHGNTFVFANGNCYEALDPLPGADGNDGNVLGRLADMYLNAGRYSHVVLIPMNVGSTAISDWAPPAPANFTGSISGTTLTVTAVSSGVIASDQIMSGSGIAANTQITNWLTGTSGGVGTYTVSISQTVGSEAMSSNGGALNAKLVSTMQAAINAGLTPTYVIVDDGPQDTGFGTSTANWEAFFYAAINSFRALGVSAPVFVDQSTVCNIRDASNYPPDPSVLNRTPDWYVNIELHKDWILAAQAGVVNGSGVRVGADTNSIPSYFKFDGCHLGRRGQEQHATDLYNALP